ncbi:hypothetical protein B7G68_06080 [Caulobacter segnis]|uniref:DUF3617 domain-containing protein n=3 Tax=Caulobacter segnis TaxID=88688 RepID=D5VFE8_CAUST|nr:hypothetical protein Cseg_1179 [Caulobacter segnis ATCC 21756]AVQ01458.1 hypothetical protein B7G68_06080 [Caulobacter segnis]
MVGLILTLGGCEREVARTQLNFAPPSLWRVAVVEDSGGRSAAVDVCANPELIASFARVEPRINGLPCELVGKPAKASANERIARCEAGGARYGLYVTTTRQASDDFTVRFALQPLQDSGGKIVQARRYQRLGACPAGWSAGDQGPPGGRATSNLLSGHALAVR